MPISAKEAARMMRAAGYRFQAAWLKGVTKEQIEKLIADLDAIHAKYQGEQ